MSDTPSNHERDMRAASALGVALSCTDADLQQCLKIAAAIEVRNPDAGFTVVLTELRARLYDVTESLERFAG